MSDARFALPPLPLGVGGAALGWMACAVVGLLLNAIEGVLLLPDAPLGAVVFFGSFSLLFYGLVIRAGVRLRKGRGGVQLPAWSVALAATVLFWVNVGLGRDTLLRLLDQWAETDDLTWLVTFAGLVAVHVGLLAAASVLLWQSARYTGWRAARRVDRVGRVESVPGRFPLSVALAGWVYIVLGVLCACYMAYSTAVLLTTSWQFRTWDLVFKVAIVGGLSLAVLHLPCLFGLLLAAGRLPSTRGIGGGGLALMALVVGHGLYEIFLLGQLPDVLRDRPDLLASILYGAYFRTGVAFLAGLASLACLVGDGAYRQWLRTARGLHV
jgi:hypothetical protein